MDAILTGISATTSTVSIEIPRAGFRLLVAFAIVGFLAMLAGDVGFGYLVHVEVERVSPPLLDPSPACHLVPAPKAKG
jgi:hypothetical protein